ncbi:MAG: 2,3-bisphosphoglycerate-dependent phosphoglycerate mutase [Lentisphaeria bacterium]|jgi:2,3-bisphosphoglycerate-dependent phosphoglycerate mutase
MTVGLKIGSVFNVIGSGEFLHSFFSTISFHLEPKGWGSRFPELMNELYQGKLDAANAKKALADACAIKKELSSIKPDRVVWEIENLGKMPPWGEYVDESVSDLSNYHITSTDRVVMDVLIECLEYQVESGKALSIGKLYEDQA